MSAIRRVVGGSIGPPPGTLGDVARMRRLEWEALLNARDLGGLATADGRETRWDAVVRSDNLANLTAAGRADLVAYGIRTVIDLRLPWELEQEPNPFAEPDHHGVAYRNLSFIDPAAGAPPERRSLAEDYTGMLRRFGPQVANVATAIAYADGGGVLVHCAAGKDRTGLITALLLALVGVAPQAIAEDYALTAENLVSREQRWLAEGPGDRAERERALIWSRALPDVMLEVLADTDRRYGGAERYLLWAGLAPADIRLLRDRLVA
jgi:protein-tyrosine phosphatase